MADLKQEFEYYLAHKADFLAKYKGKFIVLKDKQVIGTFDNRLTAIQETMKSHPLGSFLVQHVTESGEQMRFHSRVAF
jgi:hypothetical protein